MLCLLTFILLVRACVGLSNSSYLEGRRIVKGYKVAMHEYPHAGFMYFQNYVPAACGSSLIMVQAMITAAHCLDELRFHSGKIKVFFGSTVPLYSSVVRDVILYRIHPKYEAEKGRNNLGIAYLDKKVPLGQSINKISIARSFPMPNSILYTSGWGKQVPELVPDYSDVRHLKASKQKLISKRECETYTKHLISSAYICTVSINGYLYHGDAGNGLVTNDQYLVGVVSFMINEAALYSDVVSERPWIRNSLKSLVKEHLKFNTN